MINGNDPGNLRCLTALRDIVNGRTKPLVLWLGAGTSAWCGYPLWHELAESIHSRFGRVEPKYDRSLGRQLIAERRYPELFQACKDVNAPLYHSTLVQSLRPRPVEPIYRRYLGLLDRLAPFQAMTTNADENLEKNLPLVPTVQRTDMDRVLDLMPRDEPFLVKLHGSASSLPSLVFTADEYRELLRNGVYLKIIEFIFSQASVLFVGYSLSDDYVVQSLIAAQGNRPIFGAGPHFLITHQERGNLPASILQITYSEEDDLNHRSALQVLDTVRWLREPELKEVSTVPAEQPRHEVRPSSYYVTDFVPEGTWQMAQSLTAASRDDQSVSVNVELGQGFVDDEIPYRNSTALHDLAVGLICFNLVYLPLSTLARLHGHLGSARFWELLNIAAVEFIHSAAEPAMIYADRARPDGGDLSVVSLSALTGESMPVAQVIARHIQPAKGHEAEGEQRIKALEKNIKVLSSEELKSIPTLVRGNLLQAQIRSALGISEAILPTAIPRWNLYPVLRLAHLVAIGIACERFGVSAARICFGGECLAGPAFSVSAARDWASEVASYTLSGRFDTDLGALLQVNPDLLDGILKFRQTSEAEALRKEIADELKADATSEFISSVNAGLNRNLPARTLDAARDKMLGLLVASPGSRPITRALWNNFNNADSVLKLWKKRSAKILHTHCHTYGIRPKSLCPCGSGERLRDCCGATLDLP